MNTISCVMIGAKELLFLFIRCIFARETASGGTQPGPSTSSAGETASAGTQPAPSTSSSGETAYASTQPAPSTSSSGETASADTQPAPSTSSSGETASASTQPAPSTSSSGKTASAGTQPAPSTSSSGETASAGTQPAPSTSSSGETASAGTQPAPSTSSSGETASAGTQPAPSTSSGETASAGTQPAPSTSSGETASAGTQQTPSTYFSSSSSHPRKYDIFLSFRGADTRYEFTDSLFNALKRWGIIVFRDHEGLQRGQEINPALEVAIKESRNAAIIVSPDYTKSKSCLFELTVIMKCWRKGRLAVFPVFYHMDPSDVRKLIADWSADPKLDKDLVESSRSALEELGKISAWVIPEKSYISSIIDDICGAIFVKTISDLPNIFEPLIGIESQASNIMRLLDLEKENEVRLIGICGMGGIGKSTLAKVIYEKVSPQFVARYFSNPIGKKEDKDYLVSVQKELISKVFPEGAANLLNNAYEVKNVLQTKLRERKVFIVLDDLWYNTQVKELAEDLKWFGPGSRIIFTSRKHDLLHLYKGNNIHEVEQLNNDDALKLFCLKAFKQPQPKEGFEELAKKFVHQAQGLPFALDLFGFFLSGKEDKKRWIGYLNELQAAPNEAISSMLKKSLEELDCSTTSPRKAFPLKELFLDVVCFFNGYLEDDVLHILKGVEGFGDNLEHYLSVLKEKSLLRTSSDGKLWMHDLLVDLGQELANTCRLVQLEDIVRELKTSIITPIENPKVKGIVLKVPLLGRETFHLKALSTMVNLRVLRISFISYNDSWDGGVKWKGDLSKLKLRGELRIMEWAKYPLHSLPKGSNFESTNLVELKLSYSHIVQLWVGQMSFPKLRHIDLSFSEELIETPNLRGVPALEILNLQGCKRLLTVHSSLGHLERLRQLNLNHCFKLKKFPNEISSGFLEVFNLQYCENLEKFPSIVYGLPILKHLDISNTCFKEYPFSHDTFPSLETFCAYKAKMKELPSGITTSKKLRRLMFAHPTSGNKFQLPDWLSTLSSLEVLTLPCCYFSNEAKLSALRELPSLKVLDISGNKFTKVPDIVSELSILNVLDLCDCTALEALSKLPLSLHSLHLRNCPLLKAFESQMTMLWRSGSSTVAYIGFKDKPYKILYLHPKSPPYKERHDYLIPLTVACGPMQASGLTQEPRIPDFFIHTSFGDNKEIHIVMDWNSDNGVSKPCACALMIVYKVCGTDEGKCSKGKFVCQLKLNQGSRAHTFVVDVPKVAHVGSHGLWVCINISNSFQKSKFVKRWTCGVSITASNKNVVLMKGGARFLNKDAHLELANVVTGLDSQTLAFALNQHLIVNGPIFEEKEE